MMHLFYQCHRYYGQYLSVLESTPQSSTSKQSTSGTESVQAGSTKITEKKGKTKKQVQTKNSKIRLFRLFSLDLYFKRTPSCIRYVKYSLCQ